MNVAVIGGGGYVAGELLRILLGHPEVSTILAVSRTHAGKRLDEVHPALAGVTESRFDSAPAAHAARGRDAVFLSMEHGESSRVLREVLDARPGRIIDLAADFRVRDRDLHARWYGPHPEPELAATFTYALADVLGDGLRGKTRLAVPGCFATAAALALWPLAVLPGPPAPALFAVTGSSGAGIRARETTHHPARASNLFAYSTLSHRHEAEILEQWRAWTGEPHAEATLLTHSGPFVRGIHLTLHARLAEPTDAASLVRETWAGRPFVRVLATPPELTHAVGTNAALVHAVTGENGREAVVQVAIDNLLKGAAGQAVQAMNLSLGLAEDSGLRLGRAFPC